MDQIIDNNKYDFGHSTEIEYTDGSEKRTHEHIKIKNIQAKYLRIWIGKIVFCIFSQVCFLIMVECLTLFSYNDNMPRRIGDKMDIKERN